MRRLLAALAVVLVLGTAAQCGSEGMTGASPATVSAAPSPSLSTAAVANRAASWPAPIAKYTPGGLAKVCTRDVTAATEAEARKVAHDGFGGAGAGDAGGQARGGAGRADATLRLTLRNAVYGVTVSLVNREADQVVRVTAAVKRKLDQRYRQLQLDLERTLTYSEVVEADLDQAPYSRVRKQLGEAAQDD